MSIINNWQALIKPSKLKLISDEDTQYKATLIAEPLERGFGLTLEMLLEECCCHHYKVLL